ncbi:ABC transporter permease [Tissierella pigra]|uniref:ABC transporter permease n=1 Tax=Tissierella pigra TaxID=2607614 RepID=A0A6N7Y1N9_9FIRM|nr:ABC transporter permease [Tissierella pigra]MSU02744.1 ABC transporter permease [Tissierella pigra]
MLTLIKMDLKQKLRNPLTYFIILVLCIISILYIAETKKVRQRRSFKGHNPYYYLLQGASDEHYNEEMKILYPKAYKARLISIDTEKDIINADMENDIEELNRLNTFYNLLMSKYCSVRQDSILNNIFYRKVMDIWNDVSGGIKYEDVDFTPVNRIDKDGNTHLLVAKYYYELYKNDLEPIYLDDTNNITYLYEYFFNIIPKFIILIPILFVYNSINKEKNTGSLKLVITQSISRWKYYISKWISGVIHVLFVIFTPGILISTILGFTNGFVSMKYPAIYFKGIMSSFIPVPNYFDGLRENIGIGNLRLVFHNFNYIAPIHKQDAIWVYEHENMEVIEFYKYLFMVLLLTILFVGFCVALVQLISAIINKEIISFAIGTVIFAIGISVSSPFKYDKNLNLSPFTMENASRIIIGTYNVTGLVSVIVLFVTTAILLTLGCRYFRRKEI